jgi:hypothetical protein
VATLFASLANQLPTIPAGLGTSIDAAVLQAIDETQMSVQLLDGLAALIQPTSGTGRRR